MARSQERSKWMGERHTKKLLGKTNWFKKKSEKEMKIGIKTNRNTKLTK